MMMVWVRVTVRVPLIEVKNSQTQNSASRQGANCSTGHNSRCHAGIIGFLHHITLGYGFCLVTRKFAFY
jgi:hypothetical protein